MTQTQLSPRMARQIRRDVAYVAYSEMRTKFPDYTLYDIWLALRSDHKIDYTYAGLRHIVKANEQKQHE